MEQVINWRKFKDEMPKEENKWYLVAMSDHIPMVGVITTKQTGWETTYIFEYECMGIKYAIHFSQDTCGELEAWVPAEELYKKR